MVYRNCKQDGMTGIFIHGKEGMVDGSVSIHGEA